jgi:DNA polymerase-3 subunit alpha
MYDAEELGLLKIDILGLRNLSIIEQTLQSIKDQHNKVLEINEIPLDEPKTYELLRQGNTVGIFQLEGEGMRHYLKELKPTDIEDIIAMVALYRPGPIELIPEFIARKHGQQEVKYPHPDLEPALKNTYGIMIYQEQLLKVAQKLAGFSLAEADVLRKAVGKKIRKLLREQKNKFIAGCLKSGYPEKLAQSVWALIEPFDRYGFNAAHATSYAVIAVQTAFLKANYPVEFFTSLLNSRKQDVEKIAFFVEDAYRNGIKVLPPDINESGPDFTPVSSSSILEAIKNVGKNLVKAVASEREKNGPFQSVADLVSRLQIRDLNKKSWEALIKAGALSCLEERGKLLGNLDKILKLASDLKKAALNSQVSLFGEADAGPAVPQLNLEATEPVPLRQKLVWEKELLGLYISGNPLKEHQEILKAQTLPIAQINGNRSERRVKIGGTVEGIKKITTKNGAPMLFVKLRDLSDSVEIIVFSDVLEQDPAIWQKGRVVLAKCQLKQRNGEVTLVCEQAEGL